MLFDELRARMLLPTMAGLQDEIGNGKQWKIIEGIFDCFITDKLGFIWLQLSCPQLQLFSRSTFAAGNWLMIKLKLHSLHMYSISSAVCCSP